MGRSATADQREAMYRRLNGRNRLVAVLRIGVPVIGAIVLVGIIGQIFLASLAIDFSIGHVSVQQDRIVIDVPRYDGVMADGSVYSVSAQSASASLSAVDVVQLIQAEATLHQPGGRVLSARADAGTLHMSEQQVAIAGKATIYDSFGTTGWINDSLVDWPRQTLAAAGPAHFEFNDGAVLDAVAMRYDAGQEVWTFEAATLTLPRLPAFEEPEAEMAAGPPPTEPDTQ